MRSDGCPMTCTCWRFLKWKSYHLQTRTKKGWTLCRGTQVVCMVFADAACRVHRAAFKQNHTVQNRILCAYDNGLSRCYLNNYCKTWFKNYFHKSCVLHFIASTDIWTISQVVQNHFPNPPRELRTKLQLRHDMQTSFGPNTDKVPGLLKTQGYNEVYLHRTF